MTSDAANAQFGSAAFAANAQHISNDAVRGKLQTSKRWRSIRLVPELL
ncbi:MAG: hypothetical protein WBK51_12945 [Polaromonas sp.]